MFVFKSGYKGLAEIIHIHAADRDAADALALLDKLLHGIAVGVIAHIEPRAVLQTDAVLVFCVDTQNGPVLRKRLAGGTLIREEEGRRSCKGRKPEVRVGIVSPGHQIDRFLLNLSGQLREGPAPGAEQAAVLRGDKSVGAPADAALPSGQILLPPVHLYDLLRRIAVQLFLCHRV